MKYKGQELKEITTPNIDNPPKKMLVWDEGYTEPLERVVCATAIDNCGDLFFFTRNKDKQLGGLVTWSHCAEIPEEPKPRRATNRELSRWLAEGNGEWLYEHTEKFNDDYASINYHYDARVTNDEVSEGIKVRKWDDINWHAPTAEYMGIE